MGELLVAGRVRSEFNGELVPQRWRFNSAINGGSASYVYIYIISCILNAPLEKLYIKYFMKLMHRAHICKLCCVEMASMSTRCILS